MNDDATLTTERDVISGMSPAAREEYDAMGLSIKNNMKHDRRPGLGREPGRPIVPKRAITSPNVLNEAYHYARPSSFSRGISAGLPGASTSLLSGTASVDEHGDTVHVGDFKAQTMRTLRNLTELLASEGASWHDIVRTTVYFRDIDRDYDEFNELRTMFLNALGIDPLPASTGIQARICRPDLLVEIEAIAMLPRE